MLRYILLLFLGFITEAGIAHPMPASVVKLSVMNDFIKGEARMSLGELESAVNHPVNEIDQNPFFKQYFSNHIKANTGVRIWHTIIKSIKVSPAYDAAIGRYQQVELIFELTPVRTADLRRFTFNYNVIIHRVITHQILVFLQQDWYNGINDESTTQALGIIQLNVNSGKIYPIKIILHKGSVWKGFTSMLQLGMQHIKEGTDHLLFLIVLLLPAMLAFNNKKWLGFAGLKYSITNLVKIVTAFTIGHSTTLLLCAWGWLTIPSQPTEVLIACSILVSAAHAVRPLFPGKEVYIAGGFGLIHGMAFASVLTGFDLNAETLALSILGFNLGIELMQLFIILVIAPWLILLSKTAYYTWISVPAAILAGVAAIGWIVQRVSGNANRVTAALESLTPFAPKIIIAVAVIACLLSVKTKSNNPLANQ